MFGLALLFGAIVGFSLGLTGGGGGIFAVPLLVYGLSIAPREAVGISLASVGGTALLGATPRLLRGEIEWRIGLLFALAGMAGAPLGNYLSGLLPENLLLGAFSVLMLIVAQRMWADANRSSTNDNDVPSRSGVRATDGPAAAIDPLRDIRAAPRIKSSSFLMLTLLGLATGFLSGMFGVGGGFVVVPALVLVSGMRIHAAVATSLMVIFLVSISGVGSYLASGGTLSLRLTLLFIAGGLVGLQLGTWLSRRLSGQNLQKIFSVAIVFVALFVAVRSIGASS